MIVRAPMSMFAVLVVGGALAGILLGAASGKTAAPRSKPSVIYPAREYTRRTVEGWTVHVHKDLRTTNKELGEKALKLLSAKLYDVTRAVPPKALAKLRKVHIWISANHPRVKAGCYHPSRRWLADHGHEPAKAKSIEIGNAGNFVNWSNVQPAMMMHELAHAYHHQVLGYDDPDIKAAYKRAVESKSYEKVLYYSGRTKRAYAMNNDQEYFAELTEAYFGTNDFYPFVRPEVLKHDPRMYKVLQKLWGK